MDGWMDGWMYQSRAVLEWWTYVINGVGGEDRKPSSSIIVPPPMMEKDHPQIYLEAILH